MGTTPEAQEPEPTRAENIEGAVRFALSGDQRGAIRRIVLWALLLLFIVAGWPVVAIGIAAILFGTDDLL